MPDVKILDVLLYAGVILLVLVLLGIVKMEKFEVYKDAALTSPSFTWNERSDKRKDVLDSTLGTNNYATNNVFEMRQTGVVSPFML